MDNLEERLAGLSPEQRELVLQLLKQENLDVGDLLHENDTTPEAVIATAEERDAYPLSSAQKRLYILDRLGDAGDAYHIRDIRPLEHCPGKENIEAVFQALIRRHESLRTSFHFGTGEPFQKIHDADDIEFSITVTDCTQEADDGYALSAAATTMIRPFQLDEAPLLRAGVIQMPGERTILVTVMHHIISDGTSMSILFQEFQRLYAGDSLPTISLTYKDYAVWQQARANDGELDTQRRFWVSEFSGHEPMNPLPSDFSRPLEPDHAGGNATLSLTHDELRLLERVAATNGATLNMVMLSALVILLHRLGCGADIVVGVPVAGRNHELLQEIVGMFVNTVALRVEIQESTSTKDLLETVKRNHINALENQDFPFEDLVDALELPRDTGRNPLFDVMFAWQEFSVDRGSQAPTQSVRLQQISSRFDMTWNAFPRSNCLDIEVEYASGLFSLSTINRFGDCFRQICLAFANHMHFSITSLEIVSDAEKDEILHSFNDTAAQVPDETICHVFLRQARRQPGAAAIISGEITLSYSQLLRRSQSLALRLQERGIGVHHIVGIMVPRSPELMIGILGILFSGAAYLPIEPGYPTERIAFIKSDSRMKLCLDIEFVSRIGAAIKAGDEAPGACRPSPNDLAYIIYTSGSTGTPKGVAVNHRSIFNRLYWLQGRYPLLPGDVILQKTTIVFDVSVGELLGWIIGGAALCMLAPGGHTDLPLLVQEISRNKIAAIHFVPSMLKVFLDYVEDQSLSFKIRTVRQVWSSGEALDIDTVKRFRRIFADREIRLLNLYGPTEAAIEVSYFDCDDIDDFHSVPIGRPIDNVSLIIVNNHFRLCPIGVPGEILIGGVAVAEGYVNRPELTAEKFVDSPIPGFPQRAYRSGDLARVLPDGTIQYLGRIDRQLKLRGFRIEPGEIRKRILTFTNVTDAVVILTGDREDQQLCAYIVASPSPDLDKLRDYLSLHLPAYMVPAHLMTIETIPLTVNGKLDKNALPQPDHQGEVVFEPPQNGYEQEMAVLWAGVLGADKIRIGRTSNFFSLGGNSLKAMKLCAVMKRDIGISLSLADFFKAPTISGLVKLGSSLASRTAPIIKPIEKMDYYPVSPAQKRLVILQCLEPTSVVYNIPQMVRLGGEVSLESIQHTFRRLIQRHESLRTSFAWLDDVPVQRVHDHCQFEMENLGQLEEGEDESLKKLYLSFIRPFDLASPPLFRCGIVRFRREGGLLLLDIHHSVSDGLSLEILQREFQKLHDGGSLEPLSIQYRDYSAWQDSLLVRRETSCQESYWLRRFEGGVPVLDVPTDFPRPDIQSFGGDVAAFKLDQELVRQLNTLSSSSGATMFMILLSVCSVLMAKLSGQEDVVLGTVVEGRRHADLEPLVGMFVNTLPLRMFPRRDVHVGSFISEVKEDTLAAFDHQDVPFEMLVEQLDIVRDAGRNPVFDVMLAYQDVDDLGAGIVNPVSRFDMSWTLAPHGDGFSGTLEYSTALFRRQTAERFVQCFTHVAREVAAKPDTLLADLDIVPPEERERLIHHFNQTQFEFPDATIDGLFDSQAERAPDSVALIYSHESITYRELQLRSNITASALLDFGARPCGLVGMVMNRSIEMIVGILGILKAGNGYVPMDPTYPPHRIEYILTDSEIPMVVADRASESTNFTQRQTLVLPDASLMSSRDTFPERDNPEEIAYVIYTSGTTGNPKGVAIQHRSVVNLAWYQKDRFDIGKDERILQFSSYCFDASVEQLWIALFSGASSVLLPADVMLDMERFNHYILTRGVTHIHAVPSFLSLLNLPAGNTVKRIVSGGDTCPPGLIAKFAHYNTFYNEYGPTETTVTSVESRIESVDSEDVGIGKPIGNTQAAIVGFDHSLLPFGLVGELALGGEGVGLGYLNRPELTSERFIDDRFFGGGKLYLTGDLCRWKENGQLEFLGRRDNQVKIRGFRIELGEIENQLLSHPRVSQAAVACSEVYGGDRVLAAYVVVDGGDEILSELEVLLRDKLPSYMVPSTFTSLEALPLNANGKLDQKALPQPGVAGNKELIQPVTFLDETLLSIWAEVLAVEPSLIHAESDFFKLGGHSLKAMVLANRVKRDCDVDLPLVEIFKRSLFREQSAKIGSLRAQVSIPVEPMEKRDYYPVSSAQKRLYIEWQMDRESVAYNMPLMVPLGIGMVEEDVERIMKQLLFRHDSLRTYFEELDDEPVQRIITEPDFVIRRLGDVVNDSQLHQVLNGFIQPFDLASPPLLRCGLASVGKGFALLLDMHHIVCDGTSITVLQEEFVALVQDAELPPLAIQYRDYAVWQREMEISGLNSKESFWFKSLKGDLPSMRLKEDFPRPQVRRFTGGMVTVSLVPMHSNALREICRTQRVTMFMMVQALASILFSKLSHLEDVVLGTVVRGRNHPNLERVVGMFVNTLPLRSFPKGEKTFEQFLDEVGQRTLSAFDNQDYPFELMVEKLAGRRDTSRHPFFDIMVELQEVAGDLAPRSIEEVNNDESPENQAAKFDITLVAVDDGNRLEIGWRYNRLLFRRESILLFHEYFVAIIEKVIDNTHIPIKAIDVVPEAVDIECTDDWPAGTERRIDEWFRTTAKRYPEQIALISPDSQRRINYRQLDQSSSRVAQKLLKRGLSQPAVVALLMDASIDLAIALLGVLKAGAAFLPLDPSTPSNRLDYILSDSGIRFMISQDAIDKPLSFDGELLFIDEKNSGFKGEITGSVNSKATDPAYIIYTSGTTGRPKGVVISHGNLSTYTSWITQEAGIGPNDRTMLLSSYAFDLGYTAIFSSLLSGGSLMVMDRDRYLSPERVVRSIQQEKITYLKTTPSLFSAILRSGYFSASTCYSLRLLILGGEPINVEDVERAHQLCGHIEFINHYGPTEATIGCAFHRLDPQQFTLYKEKPVIGRPIRGMHACIVSSDNHRIVHSNGTSGELAVAGSGVASGYLNRPELTHERFPEDGPVPDRRMYLTGDLAIRLPDGSIQLTGRIGNQVKIRGFRVELEEIEAHLKRCGGVAEAAVVARRQGDGFDLIAYLAPKDAINSREVRYQLALDLPEYMIPPTMILLDYLPLTANNKVDRRALPEPEPTTTENSSPPRDGLEERLTELWAEVLKKDSSTLDVYQDFFELGGQSLKATILSSRIHKEFHVRMPLTEIFRFPSIRQMAEFVREADTQLHKGIAPVEKRDYYPLSSAQTRLYILQQMDSASIAYNRFRVVFLEHAVDLDRIQQSFERLIQRHESLRTSFRMLDDRPVQRVHDHVRFFISKRRVSRPDTAIESFVRPFELSEAPLLRAEIVELPGNRAALLVDMHHIVADGISQVVMVRDFLVLYDGNLPDGLSLQYRDFAVWQSGEEFKLRVRTQENFWLEQLLSPLPLLDLPTDFPRPQVQQFDGNTVVLELGPATTHRIRGLLKEADATLFMTLLSVYYIWLSRLTGQEDIIAGVPVAGRPHHDLQQILGMFVNTLAIRGFPVGDASFLQFLGDTRVRVLEAFDNQDVQFEDLVERLDVPRDAGRNPLFDVSFNVLNYLEVAEGSPDDHQKDGDFTYEHRVAKFDIGATVIEEEDCIQINFQYCTHLFTEATIRRFVHYFERLLLSILDNPQAKLKDLDMVPEIESQRILHEFNNSEDDTFNGDDLCRLFLEREQAHPHRIAVIHDTEALTYGELGLRARKIASTLKNRGVGVEHIVALHMQRSLALMESIFGILFSGGAYMPLDLELPVRRKSYMLADSNTSVVLASYEERVSLPSEYTNRVMMWEEIDGDGTAYSVKETTLAYVIYTSGTTGLPKGVMIEHRGVVNLVNAIQRDIYADIHEVRVGLLAPVHFDASVKQIFPALLGGHTLAVVPDHLRLDGEALVRYFCRHTIDILDSTPAMMQLLLDEGEGVAPTKLPVSIWLIGGEALDKAIYRRLRAASVKAGTQIFNVYGPTECTDVSSFFQVTEESIEDFRQIPIGKPIKNTRIYIYDRFGNLQPPGIPGELVVTGAGTGRGYLNHPELTVDKFARSEPRMYRTGDLARWREDGLIEFLGRIDHQVKIRGYRIELQEIEHCLMSLAGVSEALVMAISEEGVDHQLAAYVVLNRGDAASSPNSDDIREHMETFLPGYMIPTWIVVLDAFPLTSNGKIDHAALPHPKTGIGKSGMCAPVDRLERALIGMWARLLSIEEESFGTDADFFHLGGHSLKATILMSRIQKEFGMKIPLAELFRTPTVKGLARYIRANSKDDFTQIQSVEKKDYYPLSPAQKRFYLLNRLMPETTAYNVSHVIPLPVDVRFDLLETALQKIIRRHETFRTAFADREGHPWQQVLEAVDFTLRYLNGGQDIQHFIRPFDLSAPPLLRAAIYQSPDGIFLVVDLHHITCDGISIAILEKEILELYNGSQLEDLPLQYRDYAQWQLAPTQKRRIDSSVDYWRGVLADDIPVLNLPCDFPRPSVRNFDGDRLYFECSPEQTSLVQALAEENDVTLFMALLALFYVFLARLSGQEDILVGTPVAGRGHADLERMVGPFVNTLSLRGKPVGSKSLAGFIMDMKATVVAALEHQHLPFEELVDRLDIPRDAGRNPLFDVMFAYHNIRDQHTVEARDPVGDNHPMIGHKHSRFDMTWSFSLQGDHLFGAVEFASALFEYDSVQRFVSCFKTVIDTFGTSEDLILRRIGLLSPEERSHLLETFNKTQHQIPSGITVLDMFQNKVHGNPQWISISGPSIVSGDIAHLTYEALYTLSSNLAKTLLEYKLPKGAIIPIICEHSVEMVAGILGILLMGGTFLPIEPDTPPERIRWMLEDSGAPLILTHSSCAVVEDLPVQTVLLDERGGVGSVSTSSVMPLMETGNHAYVIYTSGTSGRPKGALIKHQSLVNLCLWHQAAFSITYQDRASKLAGFGFDASVWEVFPYLIAGSSLVIVPSAVKMDPILLNRYFEKYQVTIAFCPTPLCEAFLELDNRSLRMLLTGGDKLKRTNPNSYQLFNNYGPTENTVVTTSFPVDGNFTNIPIGTPIWNQEIFICDQYGNVQPVGVPGELWVSGVGLASGYLNQPDLTAESFAHVNIDGKGEVLAYKTGDLCRWRVDGTIEFLGRRDNQVQIRGFRIEMGEIEQALLRSGKLKDVVLVCRTQDNGDSYLAAYLVMKTDEASSDSIRQFLEGQLPQYMIPSYMIPLDSLPLTANGKIDHKKLPVPDMIGADVGAKLESSLQLRLQQIWSGVLLIDRERINLESDFFSLGGHSLKATMLAGRIHKELNVEISLVDIFRYPTIRSQASLIESSAPQRFTEIQQLEKKEYYDLSPAQKRLYILNQFDPQSTVYNIPMLIPIAPSLDTNKIQAVFKALIERHESIRTSFVTVNDTPVQRIHRWVDFALEYFNVSGNLEDSTIEKVFAQFVQPFDLSYPPLFRGGIVDVSENSRFLMLDMHHIISDGASVQILEHEFFALSQEEPLSQLYIQYKDYASWLQSGKMKERIKGQELCWIDRFAGWVQDVELPTDFLRPRNRRFSGRSVRFQLEASVCRNLERYGRDSGLTPFMMLLTCLTILIGKLSGQEDVVIGTAVAGRRHVELEPLVGMFVNTLALRHVLDGDIRLRDYTDTVKQQTLEDFDNQDFPFEGLVDLLQLDRDTGRNPLFDVMLTFHEAEDVEVGDSPANIHGVSRFDMSWNFYGNGDRMCGSVEYSDELFKRETVERFIGYFSQIAGQLLENKELLLRDFDILPPGERRLIFEKSQSEELDIPSLPLHELFNRQSEGCGDRLAVEIDDSHLTYKELNLRSDLLANYLHLHGIGRGCLVALFFQRSLAMTTGIFGVLKAGAAYIPLDPDYPIERLEFIIKDSGAKAVLVADGDHLFSPLLCNVVNVNEAILANETTASNETVQICDPAYVIYTSGTTGQPKGVLIEHRSVANLALYQARRFGIQESERILQFSSYCFDASVEQMFIALFTGAGLVLVDKSVILDVERFHRYIIQKQVTHIHAVPSFLALLDLSGNNSIKRVVAGGDTCPPALVAYFTGFCDFYNEYGPTETTVTSIEARFEGAIDTSSVTIGGPLGNTSAYILDQYGYLAPDGVTGELFIGGSGVGRGYVNRSLLTHEAFVHDHVSGRGTMYRTGDFCRRNGDGNIEFLGRRDHQIKIRGFRIEAGEIEQALLEQDGVKEALVLAWKNRAGDVMLTGYLVMEKDYHHDDCIDYVRRRLEKRLPSYMVPSVLARLDSFPLNANGKVDRSGLPFPELETPNSDNELETALERSLRNIWAGVLSIDEEQIGRESDFFSIGGHSLKATILASRIHKELSVNLPLADIFNYPTIGRLATLIEETSPERFACIEPLEKREYYQLSSAQARLYILQQMDRDSTAYNIPMAISIGDAIPVTLLTEAFETLINRHESLRTSFMTVNDSPVQQVRRKVEFNIEEYSRDTAERFIRPFDLSVAPLLRVGLSEGFMLLDIHHIISDGISLQVLEQEFLSIIEKRSLPYMPVQYKDYAAWFAGDGMRGRLQLQEKYWLDLYSNGIPVVDLPLDTPRPRVPRFSGDLVRFNLGKSICKGMGAVCQNHGITMFMALTAAFCILLSKLSGEEDVALGTVVSGRRHVDVERIVGMFVNTLVLRIEPSGNKPLQDYFYEVRDRILTALDNQDYPFENLVEKLQPERNPGRNPLFDVMIEHHDGEAPTDDDRSPMTHRVSRFDMSWTFVSHGDGIRGSVEFSDELFHRHTVIRFVDYFKTIAAQLVSGKNLALKEIGVLSAQERQWILDILQGESIDIPFEPLQGSFQRQVAKGGENVALALDDSFLTYGELHRRSNCLACYLNTQGASAGHLVAICLERSLEMIIAILGVLKSGSAYVPMDPTYPVERLRYILEDSGSILAVISGSNNPIQTVGVKQLDIDGVNWREDADNLETSGDPQAPAYVIYTSGTSGRPKGVVVEHRSIVNLIQTQIIHYGIDASDCILQFSSFSFDASLEQIFLALSSGASLVLAQRETILDIERFTRYIVSRQVTHIDSVPSFLALLKLPDKHHIRRIVTGGDVCPPALAETFGRQVKFFNAYGPTETTVTSLSGSLGIGGPLANVQTYILDINGSMAPTGVAGELVIGGPGVARGYLNQPELTDDRFVTDPIIGCGRVYRSGDLCRLKVDGKVEFLGRLDSQINIRGNRIEPLEIQHMIGEHEAVTDAAVISKTGENGDSLLVAYLVLTDESLDMEEIRRCISRRLPSYMIPSHWIALDALPLNPNGKLDLKRLPESGGEGAFQLELPVNQVEERLLDIWSDILGLDKSKISTDIDFFSLGGHSLTATTLVSRIRALLKIDVPLSEIFNFPTIKGIASYIGGAAHGRDLATKQQLVPLKFNGEHLPNMFFIHDGLGQVSGYLKLCDLLADSHNYWGIRTNMESEIHLNKAVIQRLAEEHLDTIQSVQSSGPYYIAGWSMGGAIAFALALLLEKQKQEIRFLGLIDAGIPQKIFKQRKKLKGNTYTFHAGKENMYTLDEWRLYCKGDFKSYYVTGDHYSILTPPNVLELSEKFQQAVEKNQRSIIDGKQ